MIGVSPHQFEWIKVFLDSTRFFYKYYSLYCEHMCYSSKVDRNTGLYGPCRIVSSACFHSSDGWDVCILWSLLNSEETHCQCLAWILSRQLQFMLICGMFLYHRLAFPSTSVQHQLLGFWWKVFRCLSTCICGANTWKCEERRLVYASSCVIYIHGMTFSGPLSSSGPGCLSCIRSSCGPYAMLQFQEHAVGYSFTDPVGGILKAYPATDMSWAHVRTSKAFGTIS